MKKLKIMLSTVCAIAVTAICMNMFNPIIAEAKILPDYEMIPYRCNDGTWIERCNYADTECDVSAQELCP